MATMKRISVREFRDHAMTHLSGSDPIAVSEHDDLIGVYVPLERAETDPRAAIDQVDQILDRLLQEAATSEAELRTGLLIARVKLQAQRH